MFRHPAARQSIAANSIRGTDTVKRFGVLINSPSGGRSLFNLCASERGIFCHAGDKKCPSVTVGCD
ncbi:hypothetical protein GIW54_15765 [Pseudomonas proteolytica]|uniref:Uncharacterized protein n=2 Tax=Pseudomonas TaxID=286 RepID=A0AAW5A8U2_9PSED|nr:hypothetical protein FQ182_15690 [Pseudomonas sp. ANT_H4]KAA0951566.1 hypothetical protein FQ186_15425 [Pseudomonas sp. ANT_H14]KAA8704836.1 hypothetical protein F4W61_05690 [Pseudomonas proteolytica]MQT48299.1 hypothetical protein [Pseudomonas helleri]MCF5057220.1 hypothetical protein [Pseudomonas proteolytica]